MTHSILKYTTAFTLVIILLLPKFPFWEIPGSQVAIRFEDLVIFVTYFLFLCAISRDLKSFLKDRINQAIFIYFFVGFVSLLSGILVTKTVVPAIGILHFLRRIEYMGMFFVGVYVLKSKEDLAFFIKVLFLCLLYIFVIGLGQRFFNWPIITTQNYEYAKGIALYWVPGAHIPSTFAGHYDLASFLITIMPLLTGFIFGTKRALTELGIKSRVLAWRFALSLIFIAGLWLLVNAAQRISIVSYGLGVGVVLSLLRKYKYLIVVAIASLIFISLSSKLMDRYIQLFKVYSQRFSQVNVVGIYAQEESSPESQRINTKTPTPEPMQLIEDRSTSIRFNVEWPRAIRALKKNPLLGTGYSSITLATDNDFLRMLGETGILGFLALCYVLLEVSIRGLINFPLKKRGLMEIFVLSYLGAIPGILLMMFFIDILEASKYATFFWLISGMFVSVTYILERKNIGK